MHSEEYPPIQIDRDVWYTEEGRKSVFGAELYDDHHAVLSDDIYRVSDPRLRTALALADAARAIDLDPPLEVRVIAYVQPERVITGRPKAYSDVYAEFPDDTNERLMTWLDENN